MSAPRAGWVVRLGEIGYDRALSLQERLLAARVEERLPDVLLLLQHPPVITLGRRARAENLLLEPGALAARGILLRETGRGGDVTYHGPGQLVGYPIFHLGLERDVHRYVRGLEEGLILALAELGVAAGRSAGLTGVWVGNEKVAAIGVGVRRWVTWHGFALNVSTDLDAFRLIVPCGIPDRGVTSLERLLARPVSLDEAAEAVVSGFRRAFGIQFEERTPSDLP